MGWLDVVLGLLLALNVFSGFRRGLFEEVGGLAGFIAGVLVALAFDDKVASLLANHFGAGHVWASVLGFLIPFIAVTTVFELGAKLFTQLFKTLSLGWLNRSAGAAFSLLKGLLVLSILINLYERVDEDRSLLGEHIARSKLYVPVRKAAPTLFPAFRSLIERSMPQRPASIKTLV